MLWIAGIKILFITKGSTFRIRTYYCINGNEPIIIPQGNGTTEIDKNGHYFQTGHTATGDGWIIISCMYYES
jgi:hypothetical protein